eukprot:gene21275-27298_t
MANYSKWDKFAADLSDSDNEDQGPQLTTFDEEGGKSIEIGPQGYKNIFTSDTYEIDVTKISGRSASDLKNTDNFVEAHKQFASYVKTLQPIEVDCNESGGSVEELEDEKAAK